MLTGAPSIIPWKCGRCVSTQPLAGKPDIAGGMAVALQIGKANDWSTVAHVFFANRVALDFAGGDAGVWRGQEYLVSGALTRMLRGEGIQRILLQSSNKAPATFQTVWGFVIANRAKTYMVIV